MNRRDAAALAVVLVMLVSAVPFVISDDSDAVPAGDNCDGVLIYEIATKYGTQKKDGFSLKNYGSSAVDLNGYYLVDYDSVTSAHTYTITSSIPLAPGKVATFVELDDGTWFCQESADRKVYTYTGAGTRGGSFNLANSGDCLYLYNSSGDHLDTVAYGGVQTPARGWIGQNVDLGYTDEAARRVEPTDSNSYFDWIAASGEYTSNSFYDVPTFAGATVTPFVFPDAGGKPIFEAVMGATSSVNISIYMLTSKYMISELAYLAQSGVDVTVMLENKPLGYDQNYPLLKALENAGGHVKFIGNGGAGIDRYSYVHNKYAIIDGTKVIVTSENWTAANLGNGTGNRGWGAVVGSAAYASYMTSYFDNDVNGSDITTLAQYEAINGAVSPETLYTHSQVQAFVNTLSYVPSSYTADVRMYMSPDNTFKALQYYIDNATTRVYTEQMDLGASYYNESEEALSAKFANTSPMTAMINASNRGVDARFLLSKSCDRIGVVDTLNTMTNVKAGSMSPSGYSTMHNKGVIIDNAVWLSSVNWTDNAFVNNRECGLYIMSSQVADFFADAYNVDWVHDYKFMDSLTLRPTINADNSAKLTVTTSVGGCTWTVNYKDGHTETKETSGGEFLIDDYTLVDSVRVSTGSDITGRFVFSGSISAPTPSAGSDPGNEVTPAAAAAAAGGVSLLAIVALILHRIFGKPSKSKKGCKKGSSSRKSSKKR